MWSTTVGRVAGVWSTTRVLPVVGMWWDTGWRVGFGFFGSTLLIVYGEIRYFIMVVLVFIYWYIHKVRYSEWLVVLELGGRRWFNFLGNPLREGSIIP